MLWGHFLSWMVEDQIIITLVQYIICISARLWFFINCALSWNMATLATGEWLVPLHEKMDFFWRAAALRVTDTAATAMRKHSENSNHQASEQAFLLCRMTLRHLSVGSHTLRAWVKPGLRTRSESSAKNNYHAATSGTVLDSIYREVNKGVYVVAKYFFLLLLNCSTWPCLGPA